MATNKTIDGGVMILYVESVAVAYSTSVSLNLSHTLREAAHKDDGRWTERAIGRFNVSGSCNFLIAFFGPSGASIFNVEDIWDLIVAGTEVDLEISNGVTGDQEWAGPAQIEGLNMTFGNLGETAEGDMSFQSAGVWAQTTIAGT